jgi:iron complex transport system substrate-binding protein
MFPPSRIVCLTEETVDTLYLPGEQDRIVGTPGYGRGRLAAKSHV